jgi:tyrosyl-tRNA synthetase
VSDFHSAADAERGAEEFNRVVRRGEIPADIESMPLPDGVRVPEGIRIDKLISKAGLVPSVTEAVRKIKAGAVQVNGEKVVDLVLRDASGELILQVGKGWKKVVV